eukprot:6468335-Amphidinium_carterae.1
MPLVEFWTFSPWCFVNALNRWQRDRRDCSAAAPVHPIRDEVPTGRCVASTYPPSNEVTIILHAMRGCDVEVLPDITSQHPRAVGGKLTDGQFEMGVPVAEALHVVSPFMIPLSCCYIRVLEALGLVQAHRRAGRLHYAAAQIRCILPATIEQQEMVFLGKAIMLGMLAINPTLGNKIIARSSCIKVTWPEQAET